ncbi:chemotaxis protein CheW [Thermodesulfovibrio hydrogeniphilus]
MDASQSKQIITFLIKKEAFGLPLQSVKEIVRYPEITEVPRAPAYLRGLTNLRGTIVPVIDSRVKLNLPVTEVTDHTRLIILETGTTPTGIIVDKVKGVVEFEASEIEEPPSIVSSGIDKKFISAVIKSKDEIIMELDLESLCDIDLKAIKSDKTAQTLEEKEQAQKALEELQLVTFIISEEEYAFPIEKVREILRIHEITEVPNAPQYVKGIITVRNQILPVIDLRKLFKLQSLSEEINSEIERMYNECKSVRDIKNTELWKWLDEFRTSSEAIGFAIQNLKKDFSKGSVEKFKEVIKENIKEDQRIVVVEISGVNLGFIVDRMKQVVRVPKDLVEPAPAILKTDESENIEGIVKLNQGERLIMLINESNLFDKKTIEELRKMEQRQTEEEKRSETPKNRDRKLTDLF